MAVANVDIQVNARSALQQLKAVNQQSQQLKGNTDAATRSLQNQGAAAQRIGTQFSGLAGAVGRLAVAYVGLRTAQEAVQAGIQREESSRRLQFLAKGYGEITAAQDAATRSGRTFGLSITESNQQFAQLYGRLRPLNVSLSDIEAAFVGFNTAAKASGATSEEASGALRQLSQALGSGALRGDELNSVLEQAPGLVVALTRELNAPISQIRKLAEEGKITSDVVIRALKRAGTEGADELAAAMDGPAQAVKNLQNEFENLQVAATKDLLPAIVEAIRGLRETLVSIGPVIRGIGRIAAQTFGTISDLINAATKPRAFAAEQAIRGGRLPLAGLGGIAGAGELFKGTSGTGGVGLTGIRAEAAQLAKLRRQPVTTVLLELMRNRLGRMDAAAAQPIRSEAEANALQQQLLGRQVGGGGGGGKGAADKAQRDRERAAEVAKQQQQAIAASQMQLSEARALYAIEGRILEARAAGNRELEVTRKAQTDLLRISFEAQLLQQNTELPAAQRKAQLDQLAVKAATISRQLEYDIIELGATRLDQIIQMAEGYSRNLTLTQQLTAEQQKQKDLADGIANIIGQGMASAFDGLIQGTENFGASLRKIASGVLIDIANQLLRVLVINQAINAISNLFGPKTGGFMPNVKFNPSAFNMPSLLPGRATGGSVTGGQPYLVGERGPELFMPGRSGGIAPTGSFGGDTTIVVNVDASGTKVQGNEPEGQALARIVAAAVNAELIKQKRPGGVLA